MGAAKESVDRPGGLWWDPHHAKVEAVSTTGSRGRTVITIRMAVTNPWELGDIMRQLGELRDGRADPSPKAGGMPCG